MDTLYIVMPAYNEEGNIEEVVKSWYPLLSGKSEDSRLVVADSGSKDRTHAILEEMRAGDFLPRRSRRSSTRSLHRTRADSTSSKIIQTTR